MYIGDVFKPFVQGPQFPVSTSRFVRVSHRNDVSPAPRANPCTSHYYIIFCIAPIHNHDFHRQKTIIICFTTQQRPFSEHTDGEIRDSDFSMRRLVHTFCSEDHPVRPATVSHSFLIYYYRKGCCRHCQHRISKDRNYGSNTL